VKFSLTITKRENLYSCSSFLRDLSALNWTKVKHILSLVIYKNCGTILFFSQSQRCFYSFYEMICTKNAFVAKATLTGSWKIFQRLNLSISFNLENGPEKKKLYIYQIMLYTTLERTNVSQSKHLL